VLEPGASALATPRYVSDDQLSGLCTVKDLAGEHCGDRAARAEWGEASPPFRRGVAAWALVGRRHRRTARGVLVNELVASGLAAWPASAGV
jgi:hypothetical protein